MEHSASKVGPHPDAGGVSQPHRIASFANASAYESPFSKPALRSTIPEAPSLSLPKGGGSIQGMGEKFNVSLSNGTGTYSIPIKVSGGRAGFHPQLSLDYSSASSASEFGLGWQLTGWNSIVRKTSRGLPRYRDCGPAVDEDVFLISGSEDLVPVFKRNSNGDVDIGSDGRPVIEETLSDGFKIRRYQPRTITAFSRIERYAKIDSPFDIHWRATSADNIVTIFGDSADSRIQDPFAVEPMNLRIFTWLPSYSYDAHGNAMVMQYKREDSRNVLMNTACEVNRDDTARAANLYLKSIKYGNTAPNRNLDTWKPFSALNLPSDTWKFSLVLDYGEHDSANPQPDDRGAWACRPDPISSYTSGFEIRRYRLCQRFLMFHHFQELGTEDYLVRSIDLGFLRNRDVTYLTSITQSGYVKATATAEPSKKSFPPIDFFYAYPPTRTETEARAVQEFDLESLENLPIGLDDLQYSFVDLDEEGVPGILTAQDGCWYYKRNLSPSTVKPYSGSDDGSSVDSRGPLTPHAEFGALETVESRPFVHAGDPSTFFSDVNGSGKLDVVVASSSSWGFFEREDDLIGWKPFQAFTQSPNLPYPHPEVKMVDVSGDGIPDVLVQLDGASFWLPSQGSDGFGLPVALIEPPNEEAGPKCVNSDALQAIMFADMSGDGLADLVRVRSGDCSYWPNLGYGKFGRRVRMDNAPWLGLDGSFKASRVRLVDLDGSGTADLLYFGKEGVAWYCNQAGNGFAEAKVIHLPQVDEQCTIHTADLLGTGTNCIIWSSPLPSTNSSILKYVDIFNGEKPHLLRGSTNGLGAETKVHYASSVKFYLQDKIEGQPWITRLPFPVHVIEAVESFDHISQNRFTTRYKYHHGFYDGLEREFRGFAKVEQWDTEGFAVLQDSESSNTNAAWHSPPTRTVSWFNTGAFIDGRSIAQMLGDEYFQPGSSMQKGILDRLGPSILPKNASDALQMREACRALKGHSLRVEIYAEDESDKADIPYSITETNFKVTAKQMVQDAHSHAVYFVEPRETLHCTIQRIVSDPAMRHDMILDSDPFGNPTKALQISYGRLADESMTVHPTLVKQKQEYVVYTEMEYTNDVDEEDYRTPLPAEARLYELTGLMHAGPRFNIDELVANQMEAMKQLTGRPSGDGQAIATAGKRLFKHERVLYRSDDLSAMLPVHELQPLALPGVQYELAFTEGLLQNMLTKRSQNDRSSSQLPTTTELKLLLEHEAHYLQIDGPDTWWKPSDQISFASNPDASAAEELTEARRSFFSPKRFTDAFGGVTSTTYDTYTLFTVATTDAMLNTSSAVVDYRTLLPTMITDHNGNRVKAAFDTLGMVAGTAILGKESDELGNTLDNFKSDLERTDIDRFFENPTTAVELLGKASSRVIYDLTPPVKSKSPIVAASIVREKHVNDNMSSGPSRVQIEIAYSDGFGRLVQTKELVDPGPLGEDGPSVARRWVCSGWTVYNNKGKPVKQFEDFFDDTNLFRANYKVGYSPTMLYDPLGQLVAILHQDHTVEKQVVTPWSQRTFDANDNVLLSDPRTDPDVGHLFDLLPEVDLLPSWADDPSRANGLGREAAVKAASHANTPTASYLDALGRPILNISNTGSELLATYSIYDIQGRITETVDGLGRRASTSLWNMSGDRIHSATMDGGEEWVVADVKGAIVQKWTSRPSSFRYEHDVLRRPTKMWLKDGDSPEILLQEVVYGEQAPDAVNHNLRGEIWKVRDQAGLLTQEEFNHDRNLLQSTRQLATAYRSVQDLSESPNLGESFVTSTSYDALNRPVRSSAPDLNIICYVYSQSSHINQIYLNIGGEHPVDSDPTTWTSILRRVEYNATGQDTLIEYGNGTITRRSYDKLLSRLERIRTSRPSGGNLQNLSYTYDAVGNVTHTEDLAQQTIFFEGARVEPSRDYTYDAIYRLIKATGREHLGQSSGKTSAPRPYGASDRARTRLHAPGDGNAMGNYVEDYRYDRAGNILSLSHAGSNPRQAGWTRKYSYEIDSLLQDGVKSNMLSSVADDGTGRFTYDDEGNMTSMPHLRAMRWNAMKQLASTSRQIIRDDETPTTTYYVYDWKGERIRKVTESDSVQTADGNPHRIKERIYLNGFEIFRSYNPANADDVKLERVSLHVSNGTARVAVLETRTRGEDGGVPRLVRFQLTDLIGSSCMELTEDAEILSYEEYFPFGSSSYQAVRNQTDTPKRYRFTGKELDSENDLYYHGARYYAAWLGRWTACDPSPSPGSPYVYVQNNPIHLFDPDGHAGKQMGPWRRVIPTAEEGSATHAAVLPALAQRLGAMGFMNVFVEEPTLPGGSKKAPGQKWIRQKIGEKWITTKRPRKGRMDFAMVVADIVTPALMTMHIYDLKHDPEPRPDAQAKILGYTYEVGHYVKWANKQIRGASKAVVGSVLEDITLNEGQDLLAPVYFEYKGRQYRARLRLADSDAGGKVRGSLLYILETRTEQDDEEKKRKAVPKALPVPAEETQKQPQRNRGRQGVPAVPEQAPKPEQPKHPGGPVVIPTNPEEDKPEAPKDPPVTIPHGEAANDNNEVGERIKAAAKTAAPPAAAFGVGVFLGWAAGVIADGGWVLIFAAL